jgi:hypothetical protein
VEQTQTDAAVFLTVYPTGYDTVTDDDLKLLGLQLQGYTEVMNRTVFLRFAPEMQGQWNPYGFQPTKFLQLWRRMYATIKSAAPRTAIVWAPNTPQSYPYGQSSANLDPADLALLDTDHDGKVTNTDDPFSPFYPGDDQVDWIGLSTCISPILPSLSCLTSSKIFSFPPADYKGPNFQNVNVPQPGGYCASVMNGTSPTSTFNWYDMYCNKPGKACMVRPYSSFLLPFSRLSYPCWRFYLFIYRLPSRALRSMSPPLTLKRPPRNRLSICSAPGGRTVSPPPPSSRPSRGSSYTCISSTRRARAMAGYRICETTGTNINSS